MRIIDVGSGPPLVVVPGIQGRWEWMRPAVEALARRVRVITFSLADEPTSGASFDPAQGFDAYVHQVAEALDSAGLRCAAVCGVSYGGLIAAVFAGRHPDRVASLVLVSPMPPTWRPDARARFFLLAPRLLSPLFCLASLRMVREFVTASAGAGPAMALAARHAWTVAVHRFSPNLMARRVRLLERARLVDDIRRVQAPTLVVTGEATLDAVMPVPRSLEYLRLIPHAVHATLARTGHLGVVTRPEAFAELVAPVITKGPVRGAASTPPDAEAASPFREETRVRSGT